MSPQAGVATGGGTNFAGFGANLAASYGGSGNIFNASTAGAMAMYGTNAGTAAAYYNSGIGGYGSAAWSFPYAMTDNVYGNSSVGFGLMNDMNFGPMYGMTDGFSSLAGNEFNSQGDAFDAAERSSTSTTLRTRLRSTKSKSKVKHRSRRTAGRLIERQRAPRGVEEGIIAPAEHRRLAAEHTAGSSATRVPVTA